MKKNINDNILYLYDLSKRIKVSPYLVERVLDDPRFASQTGSEFPNTHHYGVGGLLQHTREVIDLALNTNAILKCGVSDKLIFIAALWHDYAKIFDYEILANGAIISTGYKRLIHHISGSAIEFQKFCYTFDPKHALLSESEIEEVTHAILAHHGRRDLGSPVSPGTPLAWLIHLADSSSALLNPQHTREPF